MHGWTQTELPHHIMLSYQCHTIDTQKSRRQEALNLSMCADSSLNTKTCKQQKIRVYIINIIIMSPFTFHLLPATYHLSPECNLFLRHPKYVIVKMPRLVLKLGKRKFLISKT